MLNDNEWILRDYLLHSYTHWPIAMTDETYIIYTKKESRTPCDSQLNSTQFNSKYNIILHECGYSFIVCISGVYLVLMTIMRFLWYFNDMTQTHNSISLNMRIRKLIWMEFIWCKAESNRTTAARCKTKFQYPADLTAQFVVWLRLVWSDCSISQSDYYE